jgi:hypothetical protein
MTRTIRRFCGSLVAALVAAVVAASAGASHLRVILAFQAELLPTPASVSPEVWQDYVSNLALNPVAVAQHQFGALSVTHYRDIGVAWSLTCVHDVPPDVDTITYDFKADLRQGPGDQPLPFQLGRRIDTPSRSGNDVLPVTAGTVVTVRAEAQCGGWGVGPGSGGIHGSPRIEQRSPTIDVPPFLPLPVFLVPTTSGKRVFSGSAVRYRLLRGRRLPRGKTIFVVPAVGMRLAGETTVKLVLQGAGVSVVRRVTAGDVAASRPVVFKIRPQRRGTIRYWAELQPFRARSNVVSLLVR